jgi:hypothetical protein
MHTTTTTTTAGRVLRSHVDVVVGRPTATVWSVVSDYASDTRWRKGIVEMTPDTAGPPAVGSRVREVLELAGKRYVTDTTVTATGPGLSYRFSGEGTSGAVTGGRSVRAGDRPGTSVFTYDVEVVPDGVPRMLRPVLGWWLTHSLRRDLGRLRDLIEAA